MPEPVKVIHLTRSELLLAKVELDAHVTDCCGALDGRCRQLERLGEIEYLLGGEASDG